MDEYDIAGAFGRIEEELISSMIRNLGRHRREEDELEFNWVQWQVEQLKALELYKRQNREKYGTEFESINGQIEAAIRKMAEQGGTDTEQEILRQIRRGYTPPGNGQKGAFFHVNQRKLDALIKATKDDMKKAEVAILRMANDRYRRVIFDAQMYAASGAGTYEKAVDMATKDMAMSGLNCVEYKNGARHRLEDYADMAIRTAGKRAYLYGEGERRHAWGITTVIVNKRTGACPKCLPWCGKVFIDDVWSGGSAKDGDYPLLSSAVEAGLYHPRCRDSHTTYFPGISKADGKWTKKELQRIKKYEHQRALQQYEERQAEKWQRVADTRLDQENSREAKVRAKEWEDKEALANNILEVDNPVESDIIRTSTIPEANDVHFVCNLNRSIYKCITDDIATDEVIITDERIKHIIERHPNDFESYYGYLRETVMHPDYIIEANKENTAFILKEIVDEEINVRLKTILRLATSTDDHTHKNSIITYMRISEKEWGRLLRNKNVLYKRK